MKTVLTIFIFSIVGFAFRYHPGMQSHANKPASVDEEQFSLKGTWRIKRYVFSHISAMDEKMADEWLNKELRIDDGLYFDFQKIPSYKELFENASECSLLHVKEPDLVSTKDYFDPSTDPMEDLNIQTGKVAVYKTGCTDHPFSELILNDQLELIIRWDGVFFILEKVGDQNR